jgi:hypothetical protein
MLGCEKEDHSRYCNCSYLNLAYSIENSTDIRINNNGIEVKYNQISASYYSLKPTFNQNILRLFLTDTSKLHPELEFELFTPDFLAEDFFTENTFFIDSMWVAKNGTREDFFDADAQFTWHDVNYSNQIFNGHASLVLTKKLTGKLDPNNFYPEQTIDIEIH